MDVYLLTYEYDYEGGQHLGIFRTLQSATDAGMADIVKGGYEDYVRGQAWHHPHNDNQDIWMLESGSKTWYVFRETLQD